MNATENSFNDLIIFTCNNLFLTLFNRGRESVRIILMASSWCASLLLMWLDHFTWVTLWPTPFRTVWPAGDYSRPVHESEIYKVTFQRGFHSQKTNVRAELVGFIFLSAGTGCVGRPPCGTRAVTTPASPPRWWWRKSWWERGVWLATIWAGRNSSRMSGNGRTSE